MGAVPGVLAGDLPLGGPALEEVYPPGFLASIIVQDDRYALPPSFDRHSQSRPNLTDS